MARARSSAPASSETGEFVCPECGRAFQRAAALGAHRSRTHGVAGSSQRTRGKRAAASGRTTQNGRSATTGSRRRVRAASTPSPAVNRDALLQALFPAGIPAREDVLRELSSWLDQAERLAARG